jgi:eukaryotic-like serine/threonine-protein kinase
MPNSVAPTQFIRKVKQNLMSNEIHSKDGLTLGTEVFGHHIERLLGRGGMGNVYLATQKSLNRQVALKVLHPQRLRNPAAVDNFLREARAAGQLNHPNLVTVHDVLVDPDRKLYCYSMEYVQGITATQLVHSQGVLNRSKALHLIYLVAKALGHAHKHEIVHRDVKPDNILVMQNGTAKLLDLGLAHELIEQPPEAGSRVLSLVGTPEFSAPEQHRNPKRAVPASDVYSLGATLFFLLVGRPPHQGDTIIDLIVRVATETPSYPSTIPTECRHLLDLMLAKRLPDRLSDGDAVVDALNEISHGRLPKLKPGASLRMNDSNSDDYVEGFENADTEQHLSIPHKDGNPPPSPSPRITPRRRRISRRR